MNKNIMSVLLPYLEHKDIQRFEQCSRQCAVYANHWPVWRNVFHEYHLVKNKELLPEGERQLSHEEEANSDYRAACKRCYIYVKKNQGEELFETHIADYKKGEAFVILEEFTLSLYELPKTVVGIPIRVIESATSKMAP
jgi:hypothetical protein